MVIFELDKVLNRKNKTRYWLAKTTGIDNNTITKIFNNDSKQIKLETIDRICTALDCEVQDIIKHYPNTQLKMDLKLD